MNQQDLEDSFEALSHQIDAIRLRATAFRDRAQQARDLPAEQMLVTALEELSVALEELRVTEETVRTQHERIEETQSLLEQERKRYLDLFENAPDVYMVTDTHGVVFEANHAAAEMFNIGQRYLVGKPLRLYFHPAERRRFMLTLVAITSENDEKPYQWEARLQPRHREPIYADLTARVICDPLGKPIAIRWLIRDITRLKAVEAEVRRLNTSLEVRVRERTAQLEQEQKLKDDALERERAARREAEILREVNQILNTSLELNEVLQHILTNVGRVVPHDAADIMLVEEGSATLALCRGYAHCEDTNLVLNLHFPLQTTFPLDILHQTTGALIIDKLKKLPDWIRKLDGHTKIRSYAGVPIRAQGEVIGFLNLVSTQPHFFSEEHGQLLQTFAAQAAVAIQNARLHQRTRSLAILEERQRLAREFHDAVSQSLFTSTILAEALPGLLECDTMELRSHLEYLHRLNRGALSEMRTLLLELHPTHLQDAEMTTLLRQLVDAIKGRKDIDITLDIHPGKALPLEEKLAFYRIAQEAMHNVIKHSEATRLHVRYQADNGQAELRVEDNGSGFNPTTRSEGMGLKSMRERAQAIGADFQLTSEAGRTLVEVRWTREGKQ